MQSIEDQLISPIVAFLHLKTENADAFLNLIIDDTESRLLWKNDDPESVLRLKTTIQILSYVY